MKIIFHLLTIIFFTISSLSAGYVPLTDSAGHEKSWVLFGVTGLKITGAGAGTSAGAFSIADTTENKIIDSLKDESFTDGLIVSSKSFAKAKSLTIDYLQIRIDTTDKVFTEDEVVYTMYVANYKNSGPAFVITYKAVLEGETMEYSSHSDGSNAYTITLDSSKTYSNPGYGELIQTVAGVSGSELKKIIDIVDYDFTNNPPSYQYYDKALHQNNAVDNQFIRIYSYDTKKTSWKLFDTRNSDDANDFDELKKGKAYWAQMDAVDNKQAGLVLGSSAISTAEYDLTDGWNLLSFSVKNSTIKKSSTALILELKDAGGGLKIWDSAGSNFVTVSSVKGGNLTNVKNSCLAINQSIKEAKISGNMDENFYLKAFIINNNKIILISNKRFMIDEITADSIGGVTTLLGNNPYTVNPLDIENTDDSIGVTDLDFEDSSKAVVSKYGEYGMIIEPLVGAGTASQKEAKMDLQSTVDDATGVDPIVIQTDIQTVASDLTKSDFGGADFISIAIDTNYDGSLDKVLISSDKTFYLRDHTFTRVFDYTDIDANSSMIVTGTGSDGEIEVNGVQTAEEYADAIDGNNGLKAENIGSKVVIFTSLTNASKFDITENIDKSNATDQLKDATTDDDLAKGAVKGVYSLDTYAKAKLNNIIIHDVTDGESSDGAGSKITLKLKNNYGTIYTHTEFNTTVGDGTDGVWLPEFKTLVETALSKSKMQGTVSITDDNITIISTDLIDISWDWDDTDNNEDDLAFNSVTSVEKGSLVTVSADLSSDLKFTPINVPNYALDGPLYSIKKAGFDMKAMVGGTTNLSNGSVSWESIDLTRPPSQWLSSQDYTLFSTDSSAGYWVYVTKSEPVATSDELKIKEDGGKKVTFNPIYSTHFNTDGTTYNNISGQISVEIQGLPQVGDSDYDNSSIVELLINGTAVELTNRSTNNVYVGGISSYELPILSGWDYPIKINISDGIGTNLLNEDTDKIIDFTKPTAPIVDINATNGQNDEGAIVTIMSSDDVTGYYIFNGQIPDYKPSRATNKVAEFEKTTDNIYTICSGFGINKLTTSSQDAYSLNIIAVDGTGKLGGGNASDITVQNYIPMLKNSIKLSDVNSGENNEQILGKIYGADCKYVKNQDIDYGISIRSETDTDPDEIVKIVYEPKNGGLANPTTIYFKGIDDSEARVTYSDSYVDSIVYIMVDDKVYSYTLLTSDDAIGKVDTDPIILDTNATVTIRPAQKL